MTNNNKQVKKDELDDFAKALLDKKTEMAIYKDTEEPKQTMVNLNPAERKQAEATMSSALDMLRRERGQTSIEEEEKKYFYSQIDSHSLDEEDDDFTTSSIEELKTQSFDVSSVTQALQEYDEDQGVKTKLKLDLNKSNAKGISHASSKKEQKEKAEKIPKPKVKRNHKRWIMALVVVLFLGACMGGYAYKVYVWDPAHVVTEEMQAAYDRLVAYADEYGSDLDAGGNLMSDSERLELLDMSDDYDLLNDTQKQQINDYFEEQTNYTYTQLVRQLQDLQSELEDESNTAYQTISQLLSRWNSLTAEQQYQIIDLKDDFDGLPSNLQDRINELAQTNANADFAELVEQVTASREASQTTLNNQIAALQSQLNSYQSQLNSYQQYGNTLSQELATAQANGDYAAVSELNTAIASNNETIANLESSIASIQAQIDELK